jgi:hypothetical protein
VQSSGRAGKPRHVLVYEPIEGGAVDILCLIPNVIPFDIGLPRFIPER